MGAQFLQRGRGAVSTVTSSPPPASDRTSARAMPPGFIGELGEEVGDVFSGRLSLIALNTAVLALVVFYLWTRNAQGGG